MAYTVMALYSYGIYSYGTHTVVAEGGERTRVSDEPLDRAPCFFFGAPRSMPTARADPTMRERAPRRDRSRAAVRGRYDVPTIGTLALFS